MLARGSQFRFGVSVAVGMLCMNAALADGPLFPGAQYPAGERPTSVAIGDLDGDQVPDLAVANSGSDNVPVLLNQSAIPGELNGDACVDQADLGILLAHWAEGCP
jgi:hypothetical protein